MLAVRDITFRTLKGATLKLSPLDDVTPLESVRIAALLTFMSGTGATECLYDWEAYVALHKLQRHFEVVV
jgi:hypothetical protein